MAGRSEGQLLPENVDAGTNCPPREPSHRLVVAGPHRRRATRSVGACAYGDMSVARSRDADSGPQGWLPRATPGSLRLLATLEPGPRPEYGPLHVRDYAATEDRGLGDSRLLGAAPREFDGSVGRMVGRSSRDISTDVCHGWRDRPVPHRTRKEAGCSAGARIGGLRDRWRRRRHQRRLERHGSGQSRRDVATSGVQSQSCTQTPLLAARDQGPLCTHHPRGGDRTAVHGRSCSW